MLKAHFLAPKDLRHHLENKSCDPILPPPLPPTSSLVGPSSTAYFASASLTTRLLASLIERDASTRRRQDGDPPRMASRASLFFWVLLTRYIAPSGTFREVPLLVVKGSAQLPLAMDTWHLDAIFCFWCWSGWEATLLPFSSLSILIFFLPL